MDWHPACPHQNENSLLIRNGIRNLSANISTGYGCGTIVCHGGVIGKVCFRAVGWQVHCGIIRVICHIAM